MSSALITGGGHGIGAATAMKLAADGFDVAVTDIDVAAAERVARCIREEGLSAVAHELDVADPGAWTELADELRSQGRAPSVLVNNAYQLISGAAHELSESQWNSQLSVTLSAVYRSVLTFHGDLEIAKGAVVNVASVHGLVARPQSPAYAAAKGGVIALTRQLSADYAPSIRVNCVIPGSVDTRVWDTADPSDRDAAVRSISMGRLGRPEELASVIAFLAGPGASYMTGASVVVDGGQTSWTEV